MTLAELRRLAELLPAGGSLTLPREALLELCGGDRGALDLEGELTVAQFAKRLGRKPSTVRGWCERGALQGAYRLNGREWRIPPAAVETFIASQRPNAKRRRRDSLGDWREVARPASLGAELKP